MPAIPACPLCGSLPPRTPGRDAIIGPSREVAQLRSLTAGRPVIGAPPVQYELAALSPDHHAVIAELRRRTRDVVRGVVDQGLATGEFVADDADLATLALLSLGINVARWYHPGRWTPEEIGRSYAGLALRMVCPDPDSQI